ncbi:hypothetical protein POTOM_049819 [Populus tomentosa]|uniref:Uncharacterized protein n=1 Tax=Populus tomentosa TaxID=118781 RepID=A0A8X7YLP2_POPTO|nr:hypothetical protein POTOM_049819 [Populus tomentosa]
MLLVGFDFVKTFCLYMLFVWNHYEGDTAEDNEYVSDIAISTLSIQFPKKALLLKSFEFNVLAHHEEWMSISMLGLSWSRKTGSFYETFDVPADTRSLADLGFDLSIHCEALKGGVFFAVWHSVASYGALCPCLHPVATGYGFDF